MTPQIFLVGGAVRDHLLGIESKDKDYVVVGADVDYMLQRGFSQVGADFPVFLHPETGEEYALARTERKVGAGYHGFEVSFGADTSLEEDLARRDLTINSMAMTDNLQVIDPFGGIEDLRDGILRHTSEAFAEDPLRVLRLARFAGRYNFTVAHETIELAKQLVAAGELDRLTPERVWKEVNRAVTEPHAHRFFEVLTEVGALQTTMLSKLFPTLNRALMYRVLAVARGMAANEHIVIGLLSGLDKLKAHELKEDNHAHWLAAQRVRAIELLNQLTAPNLLAFLEQAKVLQDSAKWNDLLTMLMIMEHCGMVRDGTASTVELARYAVLSVNADDLVGKFKGPEIGKALKQKRLAAITGALHYSGT
jgi:tRNA nucleotidyltransferase (CCA-adding enzyme)